MQSELRGRDLIGDLDFTKEEVETILDVAWDLKMKRALGERHNHLQDKTLAMLFFFSSTRTRASFESGMAQLGGHAAFIESRTTQVSHGDTEKELGEILGRYFEKNIHSIPNLIDGFNLLNKDLKDQLDVHHTIGQTFFMKDGLDYSMLRSVWKRKIKPLINEYFFDESDIADTFVFEKYWPLEV